MNYCQTIQDIFNKVELLKLSKDIYVKDDAIDKYTYILTYNNFYPKYKMSTERFIKKRTDLFGDSSRIKKSIDNSKKLILSCQQAQVDYINQLRIQQEDLKEKKQEEEKLKLEAQKEEQKKALLETPIKVNKIDLKGADLANEDGIVDNSSIANYIIKTYNPFRYDGNSYYYVNGIYVLDDVGVGKSKVSQIIDEIIEQVYKLDDPLKNGKLENKRIKIISEIQALVMMRNRFETNPFDQYTDMICIKNGILKFDWKNEKVELLPHSSQYIFRMKFAFEYKEGLDTGPVERWLETLSTPFDAQIVNKATYNSLIEIAASAIHWQLCHTSDKISYLAIGIKNAGKTTYLEKFLKQRVFGIDACSGTSLKSLCDDRFGKDTLIGKAINICDDITDSVIEYASEWKKLTGGAFVEVELKFRSKVNILFPLAIFSANDFPKLNNVKEDLAFWYRWKVVEFSHIYDKNSQYADTELDQYVSPYILLVIKKIFELHKGGMLITDDELNNKLLENWKRDTDSFYSFIYNKLEYDVDGYVPKKYLYEMYREYCEEKSFNVKKLPMMFNDEILKLISPEGKPVDQKRITLKDGSFPNVYVGIRLKTSQPGNILLDTKVFEKQKVVKEPEQEDLRIETSDEPQPQQIFTQDDIKEDTYKLKCETEEEYQRDLKLLNDKIPDQLREKIEERIKIYEEGI